MILDSQLTIKPKGYLYNLNGDCAIGIQSIPDSLNEYRLGLVFLSNFYTGLDFETNHIYFGTKKESTGSQIVDKTFEIAKKE